MRIRIIYNPHQVQREREREKEKRDISNLHTKVVKYAMQPAPRPLKQKPHSSRDKEEKGKKKKKKAHRIAGRSAQKTPENSFKQ